MSRKSVVLPSVMFAAVGGLASAQTERSHDAHVHGRSQIDLVYQDGALTLTLLAPGMDIVGFEHVPGDDGERGRVADAITRLQASTAWLTFDPASGCSVTRAEAHTHGYGDDEESGSAAHAHDSDAGDGHTHGDEHDGHDHDHEADHAEFHLSVSARCDAQPDAVILRLHEQFPGLEVVRIDMITDTGQNRVELRRGQTRVALSE